MICLRRIAFITTAELAHFTANKMRCDTALHVSDEIRPNTPFVSFLHIEMSQCIRDAMKETP
jgi:hypothetical protein